ncbi:probable methyltransferase-like protein 24 [Ruditapes philippinarum]|uniref:probable methyltransferase-like protein 24 n=1 Tax=Ruditapes philippinarum TaxID=129788 RepID=UPI00295B2312|nr:probable methyltransferase-like protein 24 [Ruditapes philippinarum]
MDIDTLYDTVSSYVTSQQIKCCNETRVGPYNAFGKNICSDYFHNVRNTCLVYSFGSQMHFEFENSIWKDYRCEIHTFDPSLSTNGVKIPKGVNFHLIGLSDSDSMVPAPPTLRDFSTWEMKSLSSIRRSLNHKKRYIDILKIDIEGWEWKALPAAIQSRDLSYVRQICLEIHFGFQFKNVWPDNREMDYKQLSNTTWGDVTFANQIEVLRGLYDNGFRIFRWELVPGCRMYKSRNSQKIINVLVEISLVNIHREMDAIESR